MRIKSSIFSLMDFLDTRAPDLVFISESQTFQSDIKPLMQTLQCKYDYFLNSDDLHSPEVSVKQAFSYGGTLLLWKNELTSFISIFPVDTPAFTPLILKAPETPVSAHIALYLPTQGKDQEFFNEIVNLRICLNDIQQEYPGCLFFLRGDSNVNPNNRKRVTVLRQLMEDFSLKMVNITHKTYHHFKGNGESDSNIDVLLYSIKHDVSEQVTEIICRHTQPLVLSHHDVIISQSIIPAILPNTSGFVPPNEVPRLVNSRHKILWTEQGAESYEALIKPQLQSVQDLFLDSSSVDSMSVALQMTNFALTNTAISTNKAIPLGGSQKSKHMAMPPSILKAKKDLHHAHKKLKRRNSEKNIFSYKQAKIHYRKAIKRWRIHESIRRDQRLHTIMTDNPSEIFKFLRGTKSSREIRELKVGNNVYSGEHIPNGFYESMRKIKSCDINQLKLDENLSDHFNTHQHIL